MQFYRQLIKELEDLSSSSEDKSKKLRDYDRTSLSGSMQFFNKFVDNLASSFKTKKILASGKSYTYKS